MKTNEKTVNVGRDAVLASVLIALLVIIDQVTKFVVVRCLEPLVAVPAVKGLLNWTYTTNTGGGFSILRGKTVFLVGITAVLLVALMVCYFKGVFQNLFGKLSVLLIVAGGLGNMIDRVFNGGHVVDFIDISPLFQFPIFNVADCFVTVGGVMFCLYIIFMHHFEEKDKGAKVEEETLPDGQAE